MKILMIGGDKALAHAINRGLEAEHYKISFVLDEDTGLEIALKKHFDLILLAWSPAKKEGMAVMIGLRERKKQTPILMLAEGECLKDVILSLGSYADACVSKPTDAREVIVKIKAMNERIKRVHELNDIISQDTEDVRPSVINNDAITDSELPSYNTVNKGITSVPRDEAVIIEQIDNNNCRTRRRADDLWECLAYKYVPCAYRASHGIKIYCLHKDHSDFSVCPDKDPR